MDHLAIMRKSWGLTEKILRGEKTIESRWYNNKSSPFDKIKVGDIVYFKDAGEPVKIKAVVSDVRQFSGLTPEKVHDILEKYGESDGIVKQKTDYFFEAFKNKKYCILIFLKNPVAIRPFKINKKGYGSTSAWICINKIDDIKEN